MSVPNNLPPAISAENLTLGYKNHLVIQHFDGVIATGQFVGIFGPNGAGKTTLLRSLLGLIKPVSGRVTVLGHVPRCGHLKIGYVPQWVGDLQIGMSGYSVLAATLQGNRLGLPILSRQQREELDHVVELVGAQHYVQRPFRELSGGEGRRLLLAQALLGNPQLLLLDEPLANLDPHYQYALIDLLQNIRQRLGITLLLTAHDVNPLIPVMTQVLYLVGGKAALGSVEEIITSQTLSALYESSIEVIRQRERIFVLHTNTGHAENVTCH